MMKTLSLLPIVLFFVLQSGAQAPAKKPVPPDTIAKDSVLIQLRAKANCLLQSYTCGNALQDGLACKDFAVYRRAKNSKKNILPAIVPNQPEASFAPLFNMAILNSDNAVTAGSAGAVVQDNNSAALSANFAYKRKETPHFQFFNVGMIAETNGSVWDIYSPASWRSGILAIVGLTHVGKIKGQYISPAACEKLFDKRRLFLNSLLAQYKTTLETETERIARITEIQKKLGINERSDSVATIAQLGSIANNPKQTEQLQLELDSLSNVQQQVDNLLGRASGINGYDTMMQNEITGFDKKNMPPLLSYHTVWYSVRAFVGNTRNKLYNNILATDSLTTFRISDYLRLKISWDGNRMWYKKKALWLVKMETSFYNRNFLQNKEMSEPPSVATDATGKKYVYTLDNTAHYGRLGSLDEVNKNIWVVHPSIYGAGFFAHDKCIGIEASAGYQFNLNKLHDVPDPNTYTMYGGLIFRVKKEETFSKATLSLDIGFYEAKKGRRAPDDFAFRLKVGIPFSTTSRKA